MNVESPWVKAAAVALPTGLALALYVATLAPGLTWAHYGADGGDLLAAALTNGVPHPSGYPLYILLLQAWLWMGATLHPSPAYLGNLFSAVCVAAAVGVTIVAAARLLAQYPARWLWAALSGCVLAATPLFWSQALITEVYGLHALIVAGIGLFTFAWPARRVGLALLLGLGMAHHLTSLLLWPAVAYAQWTAAPAQTAPPSWTRRGLHLIALFGGALILGALLYVRLPWVAGGTDGPPPVNWGYARDAAGVAWVVSGAPYRIYLFAVSPSQWLGRLAAMGQVLIEQFTVVGLLASLGGLAVWDHGQPRLRTLALIWAVPVSIYATGYRTADSYIYLIPVVWLLCLTLAQGLASAAAAMEQAAKRPLLARAAPLGMSLAMILFVVGMAAIRLPSISLRQDDKALTFLAQVAQEVTPGSVIITTADAETFALWYAAWANDRTLDPALPEVFLLNSSLVQFGWYRELVQDLYPALPGIAEGVDGVIQANRGERPIFFAEQITKRGVHVAPAGPLYRLQTE